MDTLTNIVANAIAILITSAVYYVWTKYIKPWLQSNNLTKAAEVAVYAAEALYGRYNGSEKLNYAMDALAKKGINVDCNGVLDAVNAAWKKLDNEQIAAGAKAIEEKESE